MGICYVAQLEEGEVVWGAAMVLLDMSLLRSSRLSIIIILLSVMDWPQFAIHIFTQSSDPQSDPQSHFLWGTGAPV